MLVSVNDDELTYDEVGNVLTYGDKEYEWESGRNLKQITDGDNTYSYTYDESGIRTSKTVNGVTTYYNTKDGVILFQTDGKNTMYFQYDTNGAPLGFIYNGTQYFYMTNQMGDVIAITESDGNIIIHYVYDEWGRLLNVYTVNEDNAEQIEVANANPIRYRGYHYDTETEMYYLQSRYYDPGICRFINSDIPEIAQRFKDVPIGSNLFTYCYNNPINSEDPAGYMSKADMAVSLIMFIIYYLAPKKKLSKYTFESSKILYDSTKLCIAKIKYYKGRGVRKTFQVTFGAKSEWSQNTRTEDNLNMNAVKYHGSYINSNGVKLGTGVFNSGKSNIGAMYLSGRVIKAYLITAACKSSVIRSKYNKVWGSKGYDSKNRNKYYLFNISKGGNLNGWYACCMNPRAKYNPMYMI
ncbi:MAG: RHS repeat-associated core domain-containing protein [Clostridiales bacterium]|nr:RHS repeat-associated core domain-containing protein [Clostridiales bacterium]